MMHRLKLIGIGLGLLVVAALVAAGLANREALGAARGRFEAEREAIRAASRDELRRRLDKLLGALLALALAVTPAAAAYGPVEAWEKALELYGASTEQRAIAERPRTFIVPAPRSYDGWNRTCGTTRLFMEARPDGRIVPTLEVYVFAFPWEPGVRYLTLIHEYLHVLDFYFGEDWDESEAFVRSIVPMDCPNSFVLAGGDR